MIRKIKQWFFDRFLPMWAKETLLAECRRLQKECDDLQKQLAVKNAYIAGMDYGTRALRRIIINNHSGGLSGESTSK